MRRPGSPPKYRAKKTIVNGIKFDSQAEAAHYRRLLVRQEVGQIRALELQPVFVLVPGVRLLGSKRKTPAIRYVADFRYIEVATGRTVICDVKGYLTPIYKIKRHLMKAILGLDIEEA
jgi:hypothetical protein